MGYYPSWNQNSIETAYIQNFLDFANNRWEILRGQVMRRNLIAAIVLGLLLLVSAAAAQGNDKGIQIYLSSIHCDEETDEVGTDEPYVLVTVVNLASAVSVSGFPVPIPAYEVFRYGPFEDVDKGETHQAPGMSQSFWGLTGTPASLDNQDKAIFVVGLMENDDGKPETLRGIVKGIVGGSVYGSLSLGRPDKVTALIRDVNSALGTPTGAPNFDDKVGRPQELRFSREELIKAQSGQPVSKTLVFSGDGGRYTLTFKARGPELVFQEDANHQANWRYCGKCSGLFFDGYPDNKGVCPKGGSHEAIGYNFVLPHNY